MLAFENTPPFNAVQFPVPLDGVLPARITELPKQSCWSGPALETIKLLIIIFTVSLVTHDPFVMVQTKVFVPTMSPVTPELGFVFDVIIPPVVDVQSPEPGAVAFPLSVAVVTLQRF